MAEQYKAPESIEEVSSQIDLRFFRHDEKENDKSKSDEEIRLTPAGREHAKAQAEEVNLAQSVAFGSPRKRTQETAGLVMAGAQDEITGKESLEDLKEKIDSEVGYGSKINVDQRLNFILDANNEYVKQATEAFKAGELIKFLVEKSDQLAKETGDDRSSTYSSMAASIAQIIKKYMGVAPRWDELVKDESKKYESKLERFFGTHQSIQESFLAKVLELTKGEEARNEFIQVVKNKGFDYAEGFEVEILTKNGSVEPVVHIKYKKGDFEIDEDVSIELINQIAETNSDLKEVEVSA